MEDYSYEHLREADVFYEKRMWREINVHEKMNKPFVYPQEFFVEIVLDAAYEGIIGAYDILDDEFTTLISRTG